MAISAITSYNATTKSKLGNNTGKTNLYATNQSPSFGSAPVTLTSARKGIVATAAALLTAATIALTGCGSSPASAGEDQFESSSSTEEITPQDSLSSSVESSSSSVDTAVSSSSKNVESSSSKEVNSSSSNVASSSSEVKSSSSAQSSSSVHNSSSSTGQTPAQATLVNFRNFLMKNTKSSAVAAKAAVTDFDIKQINMTDSSAMANKEYVYNSETSTNDTAKFDLKYTIYPTGEVDNLSAQLVPIGDDGTKAILTGDEYSKPRLLEIDYANDRINDYKINVADTTLDAYIYPADSNSNIEVFGVETGKSYILSKVSFVPSH